jgi:glycosyltransferase involved in cell wall biosynthesis
MPVSNPAKVIRIIARLNVGGPAKHVVWLTAGIDQSRYQTVLVAGKVPPGEGDMGYFAAQSGVSPLFIPEMSREISLKDVATVWKLFRLFRHEKPDLVHTHTAKAGTVGRVAGLLYCWLTPTLLLGRPRNCKFVHTYHGHIFHSYYGSLKTRVFLAIEKMLAWLITDRIVVVSEQQRREIWKTFRLGTQNQFRVIPLGLDLDVFNRSSQRRQKFRDELRVSDEVVLVGIVGRLTEIKNHALFLEAVSEFNRNFDFGQAHFVIVGDGRLRQPLEAQCRSLGLTGKVTFAGERKDPEYFYPALDVVALTSLNEGTPLTLIEAMANSRPVISTRVGGVVDLLGATTENGDIQVCERGVSVTPGDAHSFARGLQRLVTDPVLRARLGAGGFEFVKSQYPKDRLFSDIEALYDDLLNPQSSRVEAPSGGSALHRIRTVSEATDLPGSQATSESGKVNRSLRSPF